MLQGYRKHLLPMLEYISDILKAIIFFQITLRWLRCKLSMLCRSPLLDETRANSPNSKLAVPTGGGSASSVSTCTSCTRGRPAHGNGVTLIRQAGPCRLLSSAHAGTQTQSRTSCGFRSNARQGPGASVPPCFTALWKVLCDNILLERG